jgi:hypothetical protein
MKEFAFDVQLQAVVRVQAETEAEAREALENMQAVDCSVVEAREGLAADEDSLIVLDRGTMRVTEISSIPTTIHMFELDGIEVSG